MDEIQIIDQVVSAVRNQWEDVQEFITHAFHPETPSMERRIKIMGVEFLCLVENEVNGTNLLRIEEMAKSCMVTCKVPIILVARYVQPSVYGTLRKMELNFADTAGNYNIQYVKGKKMIFHLSHTGEKAPVNNKKNYPVFQEAGLKVIFYLLQAPENVSKPFREIKEYSGVSIGTVKNVIDELENRKFILTTQKKRVLKERRILLDLWSENYNQVLKPKLLLSNLIFAHQSKRKNGKRWHCPMVCYGAESVHLIY